jgi:hypothetical protein
MVLAGFGLFLLYFQTTELIQCRQSVSWPVTTGTLSVRSGPYRKELSYQYSVVGTLYHSERVVFGELGNQHRSQEWNSMTERPDGAAVTVYYDPANPQKSTLFAKTRDGSWFNFVLGPGFLLMGIIFFAVLPGDRLTARTGVGRISPLEPR